MKLSKGDKDIGFSVYEDGKPLSATVEAAYRPAMHMPSFGDFGLSKDKKVAEYEAATDQWQAERPADLGLQVTLGVGLDRVSAFLSEEESQALRYAISNAEAAIDRRKLEIKEWRERRPKKGEA